MKTRFWLLFFCLFFLNACTSKKNTKSSFSHTQKLQRPLSVSFASQKEVLITKKNPDLQVTLKIYLKTDKSKKLFEVHENITATQINLNLPDDISEYTYIIAVAESSGNSLDQMTAVDTYKIGEQDLINQAKQKLKNRN